MTGSPLEDLARALSDTGRLVDGVRDEQWDEPTPCAEWTVRDLVQHVVDGNRLFAHAAVGGGAEPSEARQPNAAPSADDAREPATTADTSAPAARRSPDDWSAAYWSSADALVSAFGSPGVLEAVVTVPFGAVPGAVAVHLRIVEALVHGWDLASATGQVPGPDEKIAERALGFTRAALAEIPLERRGAFAASRPSADDAPALDRLAAMLGRDVGAETSA